MTALTYAIAVIVILGFCALGLSIGLIVRNKGLTTCGRASTTVNGEEITCPSCGAHKGDACKREKEKEAHAQG